MTIPLTDDLVGKRVRCIEMKEDHHPIPKDTIGTIYHVGGDVINVKWDNGRTLGLIIDVDEFELVN